MVISGPLVVLLPSRSGDCVILKFELKAYIFLFRKWEVLKSHGALVVSMGLLRMQPQTVVSLTQPRARTTSALYLLLSYFL